MCVVMVVSGQRAPFAGSRPTGYKDKLQTNNANTATNTVDNTVIADRFGGNTNNVVAGTTERLPHLALGDRDIVDRLNGFPVDQRPFWLVNAAAIEAQKNQGRPSTPTNQNVGEIGNRFGSESNAVSGSRPNYPSVVYPLEMTSAQQIQAQQAFNNKIQQSVANNNINNRVNISPSPPSRIVVQQPLVAQQTINRGFIQAPQPVQGGYRG